MKTKLDTGSIVIEKIIVHSIPRHRKGDYSTPPTYSEQESELVDGLRVFFKDKIVQSLNSNKELRVCFDSDNPSLVPTYIKNIINSDAKDFVKDSKSIAEFLFKTQDGQNSSGILVIIYGKINDKKTCIIIKLEKDSGAQLELNTKTNSYDIKDVQNLMLTQKTRIYKIGLFVNRIDSEVEYDGVVVDLQITPSNNKEITTWFIQRFLGCEPLEDPRITTKKFYDLSTTFIQSIDDQYKKAKYIQDLNSYLQMNSRSISADEFATSYLETSDKDKYTGYLKDKNFQLSHFPKNNSYINNKIKKITMTLDNDISIIGQKGTFDDHVKIEDMENGKTKVEIISKVKSIQ